MICMRRGYGPYGDCGSSLEFHHLSAHLSVPRHATGLVIVAWESGCSRHEALKRGIAESLRSVGLGTCVVDLLEPDEVDDPTRADDVELLAGRLAAVATHLRRRPDTARLRLAVVGGDRSAPASLLLAVREPELLRAVVCCAGEVDQAPIDPAQIAVPTILVVPSGDKQMLAANEEVFWSLRCTSQLAVIRGAGRRFHEPGTLAACKKVVTQWCRRHLGTPPAPARPRETALSPQN